MFLPFFFFVFYFFIIFFVFQKTKEIFFSNSFFHSNFPNFSISFEMSKKTKNSQDSLQPSKKKKNNDQDLLFSQHSKMLDEFFQKEAPPTLEVIKSLPIPFEFNPSKSLTHIELNKFFSFSFANLLREQQNNKEWIDFKLNFSFDSKSQSIQSKLIRFYLITQHVLHRKTNTFNLLLAASCKIKGLSSSQWKIFCQQGLVISEKIIDGWLDDNIKNFASFKNETPHFVVIGMDIQQILKNSKSGSKSTTELGNRVVIVESFQRFSHLSEAFLHSPFLFFFPQIAQVNSLFKQLELKSNITLQLLSDGFAKFEPSLCSEVSSLGCGWQIGVPFLEVEPKKKLEINEVLSDFWVQYCSNSKQKWLVLILDEQLFRQTWNLLYSNEKSTTPSNPSLPIVPMPDLFHWRWHLLRMAFKIWPCLYEIAIECEFPKFDVEDKGIGFKFADNFVRSLAVPLHSYLLEKFSKSSTTSTMNEKEKLEKLNNAFFELKDVSDIDSMLLTFDFLFLQPYFHSCDMISKGTMGRNEFLPIWAYWGPMFVACGNTHYARLTATVIYLSEWIEKDAFQLALESTIMRSWKPDSMHSVPVGLTVEKVNKFYKKLWGKTGHGKENKCAKWLDLLYHVEQSFRTLDGITPQQRQHRSHEQWSKFENNKQEISSKLHSFFSNYKHSSKIWKKQLDLKSTVISLFPENPTNVNTFNQFLSQQKIFSVWE